jgi:hypothetical protein
LLASFAANASVDCSAMHLAKEKRMPATPRRKTETDRAIDYIARVLEDCERLRSGMSKSARSSPPVKRRQKPVAKDRIGKK